MDPPTTLVPGRRPVGHVEHDVARCTPGAVHQGLGQVDEPDPEAVVGVDAPGGTGAAGPEQERVVGADRADLDGRDQVEVHQPPQQGQAGRGLADDRPRVQGRGRSGVVPLVVAAERREPDVHAVATGEEHPPRLLVAQVLRQLLADPLVVLQGADDGPQLGVREMALPQPPGHVGIGGRRHPGGDRLGVLVESRRGQGGAAGQAHHELRGRQAIAVSAVDRRLARVQCGHVRAGLGVHLLEVVAQHRRQHASAPVVGVHADPGQPGDRDLSRAVLGSGDAQGHREDPVDAGVGALVCAVDSALDLGGEPLVDRQPEQLLLGRRGRDLGEPHGLVGGEVAVGVGGQVHPDVRHAPSQAARAVGHNPIRCRSSPRLRPAVGFTGEPGTPALLRRNFAQEVTVSPVHR